MTPDITYVIPFKSRGRLFVEIPEYVEREGRIVAGEPLQLELVGEDIIYHRTTGRGAPAVMEERTRQQPHRQSTSLYQRRRRRDSPNGR